MAGARYGRHLLVDGLLLCSTLLALLGSALIAGAFFAFSTFVMKALAKLPAPEGIAAMQSINVVVINPWFLGVFLGTAALCLVTVGFGYARWPAPYALWLVLGAVLYVVGTLAVTMLFNVPRNELLATVAPAEPESARIWHDYLSGWTTWNHVRTIASLAATASYAAALASWAGR